jgi:hypothetical protein
MFSLLPSAAMLQERLRYLASQGLGSEAQYDFSGVDGS